jgi:hypothetical protein
MGLTSTRPRPLASKLFPIHSSLLLAIRHCILQILTESQKVHTTLRISINIQIIENCLDKIC